MFASSISRGQIEQIVWICVRVRVHLRVRVDMLTWVCRYLCSTYVCVWAHDNQLLHSYTNDSLTKHVQAHAREEEEEEERLFGKTNVH